MSTFLKDLTCQYEKCKRFYKDPIVLPCGNSICKEHLIDISKYCCQFCLDEHQVSSENPFPLNINLNQLLKSNWYLNDDQKLVKELLEKLKITTRDLNLLINDSDSYLIDYFRNIKTQIDLDKKEVIGKIESIYDSFHKRLNKFEVECKSNQQKECSIEHNQEIIEKNNEHIFRIQEDFRIPDNANVKNLIDTIKQSIHTNNNLLQSLKSDLLLNRDCVFESNLNQLGDDLFGQLIFKELAFFNSSKQKAVDKIGECIKTFKGHSSKIEYVKSICKSQRIVSVSYDKTIKIWNSETSECLFTVRQESELNSLILVDDNNFLTGSKDGFLRFWSLNNDEISCFNQAKEQSSIISLCLLSDDRIAVLSNIVSIRKIDSLALITQINISESNGNIALRLISKNDYFVMSFYDGTIEIWDSLSLKCVRSLDAHKEMTFGLEVSEDENNIMYSGSYDGMVKVWDIETGDCLKTINVKNQISAIKLIATDLLAIGLKNTKGEIVVYDLADDQSFTTLNSHKKSVFNFDSMSNGNFLSCSADSTIKMWSM